VVDAFSREFALTDAAPQSIINGVRELFSIPLQSERRKQLESTVFVVQENPRVDVVSAAQWGNLIALSNPFDQVHLNPGRIVSQFRRKLRRYSDNDWLLPLGDPAMIGIAFAVAADANEGRVNLLKWDRLEKHYYPVKISVRGGIEELTT